MRRIQTILVPIDFSPDANEALVYAMDLAKAFKARIHLLHVYQLGALAPAPHPYIFPPEVLMGVRDAAAARLEGIRMRASADGVESSADLLPGSPSVGIVETAEKVSADLIVMGTRGLSGLRHVMLGSVAERTLRHAPCPVLIVKAEDDEAAEGD